MQTTILTTIISCVFSFAGAFFAVYYQRRTMRETSLFQKRADTFAKFLLDFQEYRKYRQSDREFTPEEHGYSLDKIYTSANMVCLYLPDKSRLSFRENLDDYIKFRIDFTNPLIDLSNYRAMLEPLFQFEKNIQRIFEKNL